MKYEILTSTLTRWVKEYNKQIKASKGLVNEFKRQTNEVLKDFQ